ncbi:hypothetical protein [Microseira wollei]|nr:hypothetical protein [Microseira wollei]
MPRPCLIDFDAFKEVMTAGANAHSSVIDSRDFSVIIQPTEPLYFYINKA